MCLFKVLCLKYCVLTIVRTMGIEKYAFDVFMILDQTSKNTMPQDVFTLLCLKLSVLFRIEPSVFWTVITSSLDQIPSNH